MEEDGGCRVTPLFQFLDVSESLPDRAPRGGRMGTETDTPGMPGGGAGGIEKGRGCPGGWPGGIEEEVGRTIYHNSRSTAPWRHYRPHCRSLDLLTMRFSQRNRGGQHPPDKGGFGGAA